MNSRPLFRDEGDVTFILPAAGFEDHGPTGPGFPTLGSVPVYSGSLRTPQGARAVLVVEGRHHDGMAVASLMWRYGLAGTLMATPFGLWIVYPEGPSRLRGVRLRTKQQWFLSYGLVDAALPR